MTTRAEHILGRHLQSLCRKEEVVVLQHAACSIGDATFCASRNRVDRAKKGSSKFIVDLGNIKVPNCTAV